MEKLLYYAYDIKVGFIATWVTLLSTWGFEAITDYQVDISLKITIGILSIVFGIFRIRLVVLHGHKSMIEAAELKKESEFNDKVRKHTEDALIDEIKEREKNRLKVEGK